MVQEGCWIGKHVVLLLAVAHLQVPNEREQSVQLPNSPGRVCHKCSCRLDGLGGRRDLASAAGSSSSCFPRRFDAVVGLGWKLDRDRAGDVSKMAGE